MPKFELSWVVDAIKGDLKSQVYSSADDVSTDTRKQVTGSVFFALRGGNFDAHNFLDLAINQGAKIIIVDNWTAVHQDHLKKASIVLVQDTLQALQSMATEWRKLFKGKVLAVTGSNGKTTTKEFTSQILRTRFKIYSSPGSFNNHWGVPLSLLSADLDTDFVVLEMGMNKSGEIKRLCEIALPDIVLVTMVGSAHIGELGSQFEIARAKKEIYDSCDNCIKIFNLDNEHTITMYNEFVKSSKTKHYTFSAFNKSTDVSLRVESMSLNSILITGHISGREGQALVSVFGRHNVNNIMAASCLTLACGMKPDEIWQALPFCKSIWGRNQLLEMKNGAQVLFDAYNASYDSTTALVKSLYEFDLKGARIAILGQMLELGKDSYELHEKLGHLVGQTGFDTVWFIGKDNEAFAAGMKSSGFQKNLLLSDSYKESLAIRVGSMLNPLDVAIIKGSRGMKMEQILDTWKAKELI